jgi:hypothetical protein
MNLLQKPKYEAMKEGSKEERERRGEKTVREEK